MAWFQWVTFAIAIAAFAIAVSAELRARRAEVRSTTAWEREQVAWEITAKHDRGREYELRVQHTGHEPVRSVSIDSEELRRVALTSGSVFEPSLDPGGSLRFTIHIARSRPDALRVRWASQQWQQKSKLVPIEWPASVDASAP